MREDEISWSFGRAWALTACCERAWGWGEGERAEKAGPGGPGLGFGPVVDGEAEGVGFWAVGPVEGRDVDHEQAHDVSRGF